MQYFHQNGIKNAEKGNSRMELIPDYEKDGFFTETDYFRHKRRVNASEDSNSNFLK